LQLYILLLRQLTTLKKELFPLALQIRSIVVTFINQE